MDKSNAGGWAGRYSQLLIVSLTTLRKAEFSGLSVRYNGGVLVCWFVFVVQVALTSFNKWLMSVRVCCGNIFKPFDWEKGRGSLSKRLQVDAVCYNQ